VAVRLYQGKQALDDPVQPGVQQLDERAEPEDQGRIDDVLAGGAPVQVRLCGLRERGAALLRSKAVDAKA